MSSLHQHHLDVDKLFEDFSKATFIDIGIPLSLEKLETEEAPKVSASRSAIPSEHRPSIRQEIKGNTPSLLIHNLQGGFPDCRRTCLRVT